VSTFGASLIPGDGSGGGDDGGGDDGGTEGNLVGSSVNNGSTWTARVTDTSGNDLDGTWNLGDGSLLDGSVCEFSGIPKRTASATFTSSGGTSVTVNKP
jgi:hypothetical protein